MGDDVGQGERIKDNMISKFSPVAVLYSMRKDHKPTPDPGVGPPVRPVCGANIGHNVKLAHIISKILSPVWKSHKSITSWMSTEEMVAAIEETNDNYAGIDMVIGSADVKALYPSLDIEFTIEKVCEVFGSSEVRIEDVDYEEMALYLSLNMSEEEITMVQLENVYPRRKNRGGRNPTVAANSAHKQKEKRQELWVSGRKPTSCQQRQMLVESLRVALGLVMKNHMYEFDGSIRKQMKGGSIGLELTGTIAQIFMMWYDKKIIEGLEAVGMKPLMYKRYVDDINVALPRPMNVTEGMEDDEAAMYILQQVGNGIHRSIQLEIEYPSKSEDKKLPILDLKMWIDTEGHVVYEHYMKSVSSKYLIHARSAVPEKMKRTVNTQEALRILLNCSKRLPRDIVLKHLQHFAARMQYSGYSVKIRRQVIESAVSACNKIERDERDGVRRMYRKREWRWEEREVEKREKTVGWYRKGVNNLFCLYQPAQTPACYACTGGRSTGVCSKLG